MIPLKEFRDENAEIKDLCHILDISVDQYSLRKNTVVCELLDRFADRVNAHLRHEDRSIYQELLKEHTQEAKIMADHLMGNTQELRRIFNGYKHDWCRKPHSEKEHVKYVDDSKRIFRLVCDRITFEEDKIFPHFEK